MTNPITRQPSYRHLIHACTSRHQLAYVKGKLHTHFKEEVALSTDTVSTIAFLYAIVAKKEMLVEIAYWCGYYHSEFLEKAQDSEFIH